MRGRAPATRRKATSQGPSHPGARSVLLPPRRGRGWRAARRGRRGRGRGAVAPRARPRRGVWRGAACAIKQNSGPCRQPAPRVSLPADACRASPPASARGRLETPRERAARKPERVMPPESLGKFPISVKNQKRAFSLRPRSPPGRPAAGARVAPATVQCVRSPAKGVRGHQG